MSVGRWWRRARLLLGRSAAERGMREEMRFHLERQVEELMAGGLSRTEARRVARLRFGGEDRFQEEGRDARGLRPAEDIAADLRYGWRTLWRAPGFTVVAVLTLGLGIGANTAVFSVVSGVILRPLPYPEPERVLNLGWDWNGSGNVMGALSAYKFDYWRRHSRVFDGVASHREATSALGERGEGGDVGILRVTEDFFRVVGFEPRLGRAFTAEEVRAGGPPVAVVTDGFWRTRLGADAGIVGRELRLADRTVQVVGVMPPGYSFPPSPGYDDLIVPLVLQPDVRDNAHNFMAIVRLARGVTREAADEDVRRVTTLLLQEHPELAANPGDRAGLTDYRALYLGPLQRVLWVLLGAVALVLLIACANVANLLLARGTTRRRELAIRATLGAGRGRIARQVLTESMLLALMGGAAGVVIGGVGLRALIGFAPAGIRRLEEVTVDAQVLTYTLFVTLLTGALFGLIAALPALRTDLVSPVREGQRAAGTSRARARGRDLLIGAEASLAVLLLTSAGLLIGSFARLRTTDLGYDTSGLLTVTFRRVPSDYGDAAVIARAERDLLRRLATVPGVGRVAAASTLPLERGWNIPMTVDGRPDATEGAVEWRGVSGAYFETLGLRLVRGRAFSDAEAEAGNPVAIINEAFARLYFPDGDALGQRIRVGHYKGEPISPDWNDPAREIIGVVADMREDGPAGNPRRTIFVPHLQAPAGMMSFPRFVLRTRGAVHHDAINAAVLDVDPRLPVPTLATADQQLAANLAQDRFNTLIMSLFAVVALSLTAIGIYGVVSYITRQRTTEIGIRMALGAHRNQVLRASVARGMRPVVLGLAAGILAALALTRFLEDMLHGTSATDPLTFFAVSATLAATAVLACYLPARKAASLDPMQALRDG